MDNPTQLKDLGSGTTSPPGPQKPGQTQASTPLTDRETIFRSIQSYPWEQDAEFQAGLPYILDNAMPIDSVHNTHILLDAQCFYFGRKYKLPTPVDLSAYKTWLKGQKQRLSAPEKANTGLSPQTALDENTSPSPTATAASNTNPPPYPTTFASIVDLISRNEPIPGIEEIPDTVLDASLSAPNQTPHRKKPWEKDESKEGHDGAVAVAAGVEVAT